MSVSDNKIISWYNVKDHDIATTLGIENYEAGVLCNFSSINKWSFFKPIKHNSPVGLVAEDYYSANDGFNIAGGLGYYQYPSQLFKAIVNETAWVYEKPGLRNCRAGDFRGYSHLARPWFLPELNPAAQKIGQTFKYLYVADNPDLQLPTGVTMSFRWLIDNFKFMEGYQNSSTANKDQYSLCLIYSTRQDPTSCMVQKVEKVLTILGDEENIVEKGISVRVPVDLVANTTYYVVPCVANIPTSVIADADPLEDARAISISEMQGTTAQCFFYPLPTQIITFKALSATDQSGTVAAYFTLSLRSGSSATMQQNVFSNIVLNMTAAISSSWTQSYTATVSVECYVDSVFVNNRIESVKIGIASTTMTRGQTRSLSVSYPGNLEKLSSKEETLPVRCEVTITINGTTYTRTETLYIDNVTLV